MGLTLTTAPAELPVSLAEMKAQLRVEESDEDGLISSLVQAATGHLDGAAGILGRCLVDQVWTLSMSGWCREVEMPFPDVSAAVVKYADASDVWQTVDASNYQIYDPGVRQKLLFADGYSFPELSSSIARPVVVELTAGFGGASDVPPAIKTAIMLLAAHWFENREAVVVGTISGAIQLAFDALVAPWRRILL